MNILIFSGGSGSETLQTGLWELYKDMINVSIIINGYDDGKSTGIVREVYDNTILGPSDLRKNQLIRHKIRYGETPLYKFLNKRIDMKNYKDVHNYLIKEVEEIKISNTDLFIIKEAIDNFFLQPKSKSIHYNDFNIGNIIYSSLFNMYGIERAIEILNSILNIPAEVFFQSNKNLQLVGKTNKGYFIPNEDSIVNFNKDKSIDYICDVFLFNDCAEEEMPFFEKTVIKKIEEANIIIYSCGTQWSSLIPTYKTMYFKDYLKNKPIQYLLINLENDKDMKGCSVEDYYRLFERYLDLSNIYSIFCKDAKLQVSEYIQKKYKYLLFENCIKNNKHDGISFWNQIFQHYYRNNLNKNLFLFDYDYTLYDKSNEPLSSLIYDEVQKIKRNKIILTSNTSSNINKNYDNVRIFSNFSYYDKYNNKYINNNCVLNMEEKKEILEKLELLNIDKFIIEDRDLSISLKPIYDRNSLCIKLKEILNNTYEVHITGKTTIEITKLNISKNNAFKIIEREIKSYNYLYITDIDDIFDIENKNKWIIPNQTELYIFLKTLNNVNYPDLIIVAGGKNTRMNDSLNPKLLYKIQNKTNLEKIIEMSEHYINNVYILTNNFYYNDIQKCIEEKLNTKENIKLINCNDTIPMLKGNFTTFLAGYQIIKKDIKENCIFMWSDCVLKDSSILSQLLYHDIPFIIPCKYEKDPYAYLIHNTYNGLLDFDNDHYTSVERIEFKKNIPIGKGYHDMSIFFIRLSYFKMIFENDSIVEMIEKNVEPHIFDCIPFFNKNNIPVLSLITNYPTFSFNTVNELEEINKELMPECAQH